MKHSIAMKIFAMAAGILALTVLVAILTNVEVIGLGNNISTMATKTIPLATTAADLNEAGLYRRIAFERLYREYGEPQPDPQVIEEAKVNFEENTVAVVEWTGKLKKMLSSLPDDPQERELAAKARELTGQIEVLFATTTELARVTLAERQKGDRVKAKELLVFTFKGQKDLRELRQKLQSITAEMAELSANQAKKREIRVLISSTATTLFAVLGGLTVAWLISRNLAKPLAQLLRLTKAVEGGDLTALVGKLPEDEIGQLGDNFNSMVKQLRRRDDMQKAIGSYIDPRIVEKVILSGRPEDMAGQKRMMTILFTDLVGFTTIGENLTPGGLVNVINRYFTLMSECVRTEQGIIDKFIGDAIMAYWGPPFVAEEEEAVAACRAALRQVEVLAQFREELPDLMGLRKNLPEIKVRIGLATGEVVVGNIGSDMARSYTVMGDTVNLASRLESANNVYGTRILISEETYKMADRSVVAREVDSIAVKGKVDPVHIFELISLDGKMPQGWDNKRMSVYNLGLEAYRRQEWGTAERVFHEMIEKFSDAPSRALLERVKLLKENPPGSGWDGVWRMTAK